MNDRHIYYCLRDEYGNKEEYVITLEGTFTDKAIDLWVKNEIDGFIDRHFEGNEDELLNYINNISCGWQEVSFDEAARIQHEIDEEIMRS